MKSSSNSNTIEMYFNDSYNKNKDLYSFQHRVSEKQRLELTKSLVEKYTNNSETALDIGCGVGIFTKILAPNFKSILGVDISSTAICEANKHSLNKQTIYQIASLPSLVGVSGKYDFILLLEILYYLKNENRIESIKKLTSMLNPNGCILISGIIKKEYFSKGELENLFNEKFELVHKHDLYRGLFNKIETILSKIQKHIFRNSRLTKSIVNLPSKSRYLMYICDQLTKLIKGKNNGVFRTIRIYKLKA